MTAVRILALLLVTATAAAAGASAATAPSGLHGVVRRGPISPVCRDDVPCDAPAARVVLTFRRSGVARTIRTDTNGRYRIVLPAGTYSLGSSGRQLGQVSPAKVRVRVGRSDRIDFMIDTGIR